MGIFWVLFFILLALLLLRFIWYIIIGISRNSESNQPALPQVQERRIFVITRPVNRRVITVHRVADDDTFSYIEHQTNLTSSNPGQNNLPPSYDVLHSGEFEKSLKNYPPPPSYSDAVQNQPVRY